MGLREEQKMNLPQNATLSVGQLGSNAKQTENKNLQQKEGDSSQPLKPPATAELVPEDSSKPKSTSSSGQTAPQVPQQESISSLEQPKNVQQKVESLAQRLGNIQQPPQAAAQATPPRRKEKKVSIGRRVGGKYVDSSISDGQSAMNRNDGGDVTTIQGKNIILKDVPEETSSTITKNDPQNAKPFNASKPVEQKAESTRKEKKVSIGRRVNGNFVVKESATVPQKNKEKLGQGIAGKVVASFAPDALGKESETVNGMNEQQATNSKLEKVSKNDVATGKKEPVNIATRVEGKVVDSFAGKESETVSPKNEQQATDSSKSVEVSNSETTKRPKQKVNVVTRVADTVVDSFAGKESETVNAKNDQQAANSKPMLRGTQPPKLQQQTENIFTAARLLPNESAKKEKELPPRVPSDPEDDDVTSKASASKQTNGKEDWTSATDNKTPSVFKRGFSIVKTVQQPKKVSGQPAKVVEAATNEPKPQTTVKKDANAVEVASNTKPQESAKQEAATDAAISTAGTWTQGSEKEPAKPAGPVQRRNIHVFNKKRPVAKKDIIVEVNDATIYDVIYNNDDVKEAKVRRWDHETVQAVKSRKKEVVLVIMDAATGNDFHSFSLADIKETSIEKLVSILPIGPAFATIHVAIDAIDVLESEGWDEDI
jgi:hypothetical protein